MKFLLRCAATLAVILSLPFDALAAPQTVNNCRTLTEPGAYILGRNISANGDCFIVAADFVNVDLDGFVVSGNGTGSAFVESAARNGFSLRNGVVTNFGGGVAMPASGSMVIDRMIFTGNTGVAIRAGTAITVSNSRINNNGGGMILGQRAVVTGNTVNQNTNEGITADLGSSVIGNTVGLNGQSGISLNEGGLVVNNLSRNNRASGVAMICPGTAVSNTLTNNLGGNLTTPGLGECNDSCCITTAHNSTINSF